MQRIEYTGCDQLHWEAFLNGDQHAFEGLYKAYFDLLYEYGMRFYPNAELVKDCIQDLFIKLWGNRANLSVTTAIKPYLYTALRNVILNKLDQSVKAKHREARAVKEATFELHYNVETTILRNEEIAARDARIFQALEELTPRQKECIYLRFYAGLEYPEIAIIMKISVKATYKIVGRAIGFLRTNLKEATLYILPPILIYLTSLPL